MKKEEMKKEEVKKEAPKQEQEKGPSELKKPTSESIGMSEKKGPQSAPTENRTSQSASDKNN